jgi:hypothetical protein
MTRLLEGSPPVLDLLEYDPFPEKPPVYVRARLEDYRFTTFEERATTGQWWVSKPIGMYMGPISLNR